MRAGSWHRTIATGALALCVALVLPPVAAAVQDPAAPAATAVDHASQLHDIVTSAYQAGAFHGAVLVAHGDDVILRAGFGTADREAGTRNAPELNFPVHSITKSFTAVLVLQLVEQGQLRLDGTLRDYLPAFNTSAAGRITIHHLLTHTSGLPEFMLAMPGWMEYEPPDVSADSVLEVVAGMPLEFEPGAGYAYTNTTYLLLARIIENATGRGYADVLEERILQPLGMHETSWTDDPDAIADAVQYLPGGQRPAPSVPVYPGPYGIVSTLDDMLRFARALGADRLLTAETWRLAFTPHADPADVVRPHPATRFPYGYGFALVGNAPGPSLVMHAGLGYGGSAMLLHSLTDDWTVVFWNNIGGLPPQIPRLMEALSAATAQHPPSRSPSQNRDTLHFTLMPRGTPLGERSIWQDTFGTWHQRTDVGERTLDTRVELDTRGIPALIETTGELPNGAPWEERFGIDDDVARWSTPFDRDSATGSASRDPFYVSLEHRTSLDLSLLARALLDRADGTLPLLPAGEARVEELQRRSVASEGQTRRLRHIAIHGLDLAPEYLWLDEDGALFADRLGIRTGWEALHPDLTAASTAALQAHGRAIHAAAAAPPAGRPLVIRGARLFDPVQRKLRDSTTILIRGDRITAVGPDGDIDVPADADIIDAAGRTVMPGLWDMHVHIDHGWVEELEVPLFLAAGVTTVRDLGHDTDMLASLRRRIDARDAIGPRILPALIMYGPGRYPIGANVATPEEARAAVDRVAALGYVQVKLYNPVPPELVPVISERARLHGMRVSGHLPNGMTGRQAIEGGFDEIQHLFYARIGAAGISHLLRDDSVGARMAAVRADSDEWNAFVALLRLHDVVVDPSLAVVEETVGGRPPVWLGKVLHRFPERAAAMAVHTVGPPAPPPMLREDWDEIVANGPALLQSMHAAGIRLVAGTDAQMGGFELQRELELYVEAGVPAPDVLAIATLGAARVMGMDHDLGSIEPGKLADLILIDGDPVANISDVRRVVLVVRDGVRHDPAAIYRALGMQPCCEEPDDPQSGPRP
jgi:CubicO group peptidase (beta-lactamase class C family)/imidazolonepropionase-like amidohydrolase